MDRMDWQVHVVVQLTEPLTEAQVDAISEDIARSAQGTLAVGRLDPQQIEATLTGHATADRQGDDAVAYAIAAALAMFRYALEDSGVEFSIVATDARRFEAV